MMSNDQIASDNGVQDDGGGNDNGNTVTSECESVHNKDEHSENSGDGAMNNDDKGDAVTNVVTNDERCTKKDDAAENVASIVEPDGNDVDDAPVPTVASPVSSNTAASIHTAPSNAAAIIDATPKITASSGNAVRSNAASSGDAVPSNAAERPTKIKIHFVAVGSAPILKKSKFLMNSNDRFLVAISFLRKILKLDRAKSGPNNPAMSHQSLFVYVNAAFVPAPDECIGDLFQCFHVRGELVLHYSLQEAWG